MSVVPMTADPAAAIPKKKNRRLWYAAAGFDMPFFIILMIILVIGLISLYSASYAYSFYWNNGDSFFFIKKQALYALIGVAALLFFSRVDYHRWHAAAWAMWVVSLLLLGIALLLPSESGIHRWIRLPFIQFQPSEIAKFALIVLFAHLISFNYQRISEFKHGFLRLLGVLLPTAGLVLLAPHLSGTVLLCGIALIMMLVGGCNGWHLAALVALGASVVIVAVFGFNYERERIDVFLDPMGVYNSGATGRNQAWQTVQSLFTIGSGGLFGQGPGNSRQKHLFLPEPQNDFIFSVICEELGFIGAVAIVALFAALVWRGFYIAMHARDRFGCMLATGLTAQIGIQVLLNIAVVTNSFPNTGISLPFFSYGGTSLVMLLMQMGVVLAVSRQSNIEKK